MFYQFISLYSFWLFKKIQTKFITLKIDFLLSIENSINPFLMKKLPSNCSII